MDATTQLDGQTVAISISDSPDLESYGMGPMHLEDAMVEFARHLLAGGARIAYGGDLRAGGFTRILFELAANYAADASRPPFENYLSWPLHLTLSTREKASFVGTAEFHLLEPPAGLVDDPETFMPPVSAEQRYVWARSLAKMRTRMSDSKRISARIVLGGQVTDFKGRYPGIAEEALLALEQGQRLYVLGGFGGCARDVADALSGEVPVRLTAEFQERDNGYRAMKRHFNDEVRRGAFEGPPIDYEVLRETFSRCGFAGLANGLEEAENRRLATTEHIPEMIALVLKGLVSPAEARGSLAETPDPIEPDSA